jgi:SsrA-binding protein
VARKDSTSGGSAPRDSSARDRASRERALAKTVIASNRRAFHDYLIEAKVEAGLVLRGSEVKSLRQNGATITEGYAKLEGDELWLHGVHVPPLKQASYLGHEPTRKRKCLVHRRELRKIEDRLAVEGTTLVPLSLYFKGVRAKVELGVGRGRRKADRREHERELEDRRRIRAATGRGGRDRE